MTGKTRSPKRHWKSLFLGSLIAVSSLFPIAALADSTTGTTLTVEGSPIQGKQVTIVVHVTGSHLVFGGRGTVFGGYVGIYAQGTPLYREMVNSGNTPLTKSVECGALDVDGGCLYVLFGQDTTIRLPYTVPKGTHQLQLTASFEGDKESHGSSATPITLRTIGPDISGALTLLLD